MNLDEQTKIEQRKLSELQIKKSQLEKEKEDVDKEILQTQRTIAKTGNQCKSCIASLDAFMHDTDYHSDCANYICIYCQGSRECEYYTPYDTTLKDKLNKIAEVIKEDKLKLITKLSTDEQALTQITNILNKLDLL